MNNILRHLPKLPPVDSATRALFDAIAKRDEVAVNLALDAGARLDQAEPYRESKRPDSDVEGGLLPLQDACSHEPQKPLNLAIVQALLERGADPNSRGVGEPSDTPLGLVCQSLPQNAPGAIALLVKHGARVDIGMVLQALEAPAAWATHRGPVHYQEATLDALWDAMPEAEKSKLSIDILMRAVPNDSTALDYEQIKRIQWLSNHCQVQPKADMAQKLRERREAATVPVKPSHRLH